jgi:hypothetical protein
LGAIYGFEQTGEVHGLVLELVEGPTLADRLQGGPIPLSEALRIARDIADVLDAAHAKGIVQAVSRRPKPRFWKTRGSSLPMGGGSLFGRTDQDERKSMCKPFRARPAVSSCQHTVAASHGGGATERSSFTWHRTTG